MSGNHAKLIVNDRLGNAGGHMDSLDWLGQSAPWAWAGGGGLLGRLMWHSKQVQLGKRKPLSVELLFDLPIAIGMGFIGYGIASYFHIEGPATVVPTIACGFLGHNMIDRMFARFVDWKFGDKK